MLKPVIANKLGMACVDVLNIGRAVLLEDSNCENVLDDIMSRKLFPFLYYYFFFLVCWVDSSNCVVVVGVLTQCR